MGKHAQYQARPPHLEAKPLGTREGSNSVRCSSPAASLTTCTIPYILAPYVLRSRARFPPASLEGSEVDDGSSLIIGSQGGLPVLCPSPIFYFGTLRLLPREVGMGLRFGY